AAKLLGGIASMAYSRPPRYQHCTPPLFTTTAQASVLAEGLEMLTTEFRHRLDRLRSRSAAYEAATIDAHSGIAGLLYVLATAHSARVSQVDTTLGERAARVLMAPTPVTPDLPGLVHGRAGRALAVTAAVQAGCVSATDALRARLADALAGSLDWPDF